MNNLSKPTNALTNGARVFIEETWNSNTTTWATEVRTWAQMASIMSNLSKATPAITNSAKPV